MSGNEADEVINEEMAFKSYQLKLFMSLVDNTIDKMCENVPIEKFRQVMETFEYFKQKSSKIYKLHALFKENLNNNVMSAMQEAVVEDEFDKKFCKLNDIINSDCNSVTSAGCSQIKAWRPSGNAEDDMRSHIMEVKLEQKSRLEQLLQEKEDSINILKKNIAKVHDHAEKMDLKLLERIKGVEEKNVEYENELDNLSMEQLM